MLGIPARKGREFGYATTGPVWVLKIVRQGHDLFHGARLAWAAAVMRNQSRQPDRRHRRACGSSSCLRSHVHRLFGRAPSRLVQAWPNAIGEAWPVYEACLGFFFVPEFDGGLVFGTRRANDVGRWARHHSCLTLVAPRFCSLEAGRGQGSSDGCGACRCLACEHPTGVTGGGSKA